MKLKVALPDQVHNLPPPKALAPPQELASAPPPAEGIDQGDALQLGIYYHELNYLSVATYYFSISASQRNALGMVLYAVALRHGWGCQKDEHQAVLLLQQSADTVVRDLNYLKEQPQKVGAGTLKKVVSDELVLAFVELARCYQQGWGVKKDKSKAAYYLEIAAKLGDPDAQVEMADLYMRGDGVRKDKAFAAKWYRRAEKKGARLVSMQWIWKEKYNLPDSDEE
ncbi:HCP-like protein [Cladochytrium replicatum]|nr:HCP-like protein [Cladochytrium replicatum]